MRIVIVNASYSGGGAARVAVNLANYWARNGVHVTLISFEHEREAPPAYPLEQAVDLRYLGLDKISSNPLESIANNVQRLRKIRRAAVNARPDVIISFIDTANVRTIVSMLYSGIPVIVSERAHPAHTEIGPSWERLRAATYRIADAVVVQTNEIAEYVRRWGLKRVRVIPNPVVAPASTGDAPTLPDQCVLAAGRLAQQKGFDTLIRAFARVAPKHSDWYLRIAGEGPQRAQLAGLIDELGLARQVQLLGHQADIGGLMRQAKIFVLSSNFEGFPNALCEAMAIGTACISTNCPSGPADIIHHGMNGMLVSAGNDEALANTMDRVMSDPALRTKISRNGPALVDLYSPESVADRWMEVIRDVSSCRRQRS